jgi:hypothetical protein
MMDVRLLAWTVDPEYLYTKAMLGCQSTMAAFEIMPVFGDL